MAKKPLGTKEKLMREQREAAAKESANGTTFDLAAYMAELADFKRAKRQPVADQLAAVEAEIEERETRRDELQGILDNIDGIDTPRPSKGRQRSTGGGPKRSDKPRKDSYGGSIEDVTSENVVKYVNKASDDKPNRGDILAFGCDVDPMDADARAKITPMLSALANRGEIKKGGIGKGTFYTKA